LIQKSVDKILEHFSTKLFAAKLREKT